MRISAAAMVLVVFGSLCTATGEEVADLPALSDEQVLEVVKINAILDSETRIDCMATPLQTVIEGFAKFHKLKIVFDDAGLKRAGVTKDDLIDRNITDTNLRTCLPKVLAPLGLTFKVRPDGLVVTSLKK